MKRELSTALGILTIELDTTIDPGVYNNALARFYDAQELFEAIGLTEEPDPADLLLDFGRWPRLVLKLLELEYDAALKRLQDAAIGGFAPQTTEIPTLGSLLNVIREAVNAPPIRNQPKPRR